MNCTELVSKFKRSHANSHILKINNFSLLDLYQIKDLESCVFEIKNHKWKLIVYPKGNEKEKGNGYISLYLEIQDDGSLPFNWHVQLECHLFVLSQSTPSWRAEYGSLVFNASMTRRGFARLCSIEEFRDRRKGYLINDCALFGIKPYNITSSKAGTADSFSLIQKPPNNKVTWKMMKFSAFDKITKYQSNEFIVGNRKWRIEVHPRGSAEGQGNSISVYLIGGEIVDASATKTATYARFRLRVLNQIYESHVEKTGWGWFPADAIGYSNGFAKLMHLKDVHDPSNGYLVNDMLYVGAEIDVVSTTKYC